MQREFVGKKILVCDPDKASLKKFCDVLDHIGVDSDHLICTNNIADAFQMVKEIDPEIIFMDLGVQEHQGYSICTFLDTMSTDFEIPVVLMAYPDVGMGLLRGIAMRGQRFYH